MKIEKNPQFLYKNLRLSVSLSPTTKEVGWRFFSDEVALQSIKPGSRILYERAWNKIKELNSEDFATTKPSEQQLLSYFNFLRESGAKSKTLWSTYKAAISDYSWDQHKYGSASY